MIENTHFGLRAALVASYIPGFALCVASGANSHNPLPAIPVIPMTGSLLSSVVILRRNHCKSDGSAGLDSERGWGRSKTTNPLGLFLWDLFMAASLITMLICCWVFFDFEGKWYYSAGTGVLAAYATMPPLVNFFIHAILAVAGLKQAVKSLRTSRSPFGGPSECPNCHAQFHSSAGRVPQVQERGGYTSLARSSEEQQPMFRDSSFDGDAAIRPTEAETGGKSP